MIIRVATGVRGNPHIISISNEEMCPVIDEEIDQTAKAIVYVLGDSVPTSVLKRIHHHLSNIIDDDRPEEYIKQYIEDLKEAAKEFEV
jgi:hypothetical protein